MKLEYILMDKWLDRTHTDAWLNRMHWADDDRLFRDIYYYGRVLRCTWHHLKEYLDIYGRSMYNFIICMRTQIELNKLMIKSMGRL